MANTTSGTTVFGKNFSIDEIVEESYERCGLRGVAVSQSRSGWGKKDKEREKECKKLEQHLNLKAQKVIILSTLREMYKDIKLKKV